MTLLAKEQFLHGANHRLYLFVGLLVLLSLLPLLFSNPFYHEMLVMIFFWATLASAWNLLGGFAGQISLGHTAFFGIGAYTSTILFLNFGLSPWLGMLAGVAIAVGVAVVIGYPCFRLTSHFFALATIAFGEVLRLLASYWRGLTKGGVGLLIPFRADPANFMFDHKISYVYVALVLMLLSIFLSWLIRRSKFGYQLISLKEDQDAAESLGVGTHRCKMIALILSVSFTAVMGTFYAQFFLFIDPEICFSSHLSIQLALISIIGGLGSVVGPALGAFVLTPLDVFLRGWLGNISAGLNLIVYGTILIAAVMYFPHGISGLIKTKKPKISEKKREQVPAPAVPAIVSIQPSSLQAGGKGNFLFAAHSLNKRFGGLQAVKDLTFQIYPGEILGLIGPNGAGKTTVFNLLSGFLPPDSGEIFFKGERITGLKPPHRVCLRGIGRTFQLVKPFANMTVLENIMVGAFCRVDDPSRARKEAEEILQSIGLSRHSDMLASSLTIAARKRLELGKALATKPELLLLDEVVAGLNPKETTDIIRIIQTIRDRGVTILMIEHVMRAVMSLSHRIIVIQHGEKIAEGSPEEISRNQRVIDAYLGEKYRKGGASC